MLVRQRLVRCSSRTVLLCLSPTGELCGTAPTARCKRTWVGVGVAKVGHGCQKLIFLWIPCCVASVARSFAHHMTSKPSPDHLISAGLRPPRPLANTAARPDPPSARALLRACLEPPTHRLRPSHWRIRRALAMRRCHRLPEFATRLGLRAGSKGLALR